MLVCNVLPSKLCRHSGSSSSLAAVLLCLQVVGSKFWMSVKEECVVPILHPSGWHYGHGTAHGWAVPHCLAGIKVRCRKAGALH